MKKIYLKPSLIEVKVSMNHLLLGSNEDIAIKEDDYGEGDGIVISSRGSHSIWDDEE